METPPDIKEILLKLQIPALNKMQEEALKSIASHREVVLISPTGTGKTLAFLLPLVQRMRLNLHEVQALILTPSRELALQIEQVMRSLGSGFKTNAVYGGRSAQQDKLDLKHPPALLIGTPGRVADHLRRGRIDTRHIRTLVLDEYDKSLETGFESDMKEIMRALPSLESKILTSATQQIEPPSFVQLSNPKYLFHEAEEETKREIILLEAAGEQHADKLLGLLAKLGQQPGIVFCNFRETVEQLSEDLLEAGFSHGCFYGTMDQVDRERALLKFRNGTHRLLLATDLAARGIDVPEIEFIVHYELPQKAEEFIHRNGRTARMKREGRAYVLNPTRGKWPGYIDDFEGIRMGLDELVAAGVSEETVWATIRLTGGRRNNISKGDVAGFLIKQGQLTPNDIGKIELSQDAAYAAVEQSKVGPLIGLIDNAKLKTKKVRVSVI